MPTLAFHTLDTRDADVAISAAKSGLDTGSVSPHLLLYLILIIFLIFLAFFTISAYFVHRFILQALSSSETECPRFAISRFLLHIDASRESREDVEKATASLDASDILDISKPAFVMSTCDFLMGEPLVHSLANSAARSPPALPANKNGSISPRPSKIAQSTSAAPGATEVSESPTKALSDEGPSRKEIHGEASLDISFCESAKEKVQDTSESVEAHVSEGRLAQGSDRPLGAQLNAAPSTPSSTGSHAPKITESEYVKNVISRTQEISHAPTNDKDQLKLTMKPFASESLPQHDDRPVGTQSSATHPTSSSMELYSPDHFKHAIPAAHDASDMPSGVSGLIDSAHSRPQSPRNSANPAGVQSASILPITLSGKPHMPAIVDADGTSLLGAVEIEECMDAGTVIDSTASPAICEQSPVFRNATSESSSGIRSEVSSYTSGGDELQILWHDEESLVSFGEFTKSKTAHSQLTEDGGKKGELQEEVEELLASLDDVTQSKMALSDDRRDAHGIPAEPDMAGEIDSLDTSVDLGSPTHPKRGVLKRQPGVFVSVRECVSWLALSRLEMRKDPAVNRFVQPVAVGANPPEWATVPEDYYPDPEPRTPANKAKEERLKNPEYLENPYKPSDPSCLSAKAIHGTCFPLSKDMRRWSREPFRLSDWVVRFPDRNSSSVLLVDVLRRSYEERRRAWERTQVIAAYPNGARDPFCSSSDAGSFISDPEPRSYCGDSASSTPVRKRPLSVAPSSVESRHDTQSVRRNADRDAVPNRPSPLRSTRFSASSTLTAFSSPNWTTSRQSTPARLPSSARSFSQRLTISGEDERKDSPRVQRNADRDLVPSRPSASQSTRSRASPMLTTFSSCRPTTSLPLAPTRLSSSARTFDRMPTLSKEDNGMIAGFPIVPRSTERRLPVSRSVPPRDPSKPRLSTARLAGSSNKAGATTSGFPVPSACAERSSKGPFKCSPRERKHAPIVHFSSTIATRPSRDTYLTPTPSTERVKQALRKPIVGTKLSANYLKPTKVSEAKRRDPLGVSFDERTDTGRSAFGLRLPTTYQKETSTPRTTRRPVSVGLYDLKLGSSPIYTSSRHSLY